MPVPPLFLEADNMFSFLGSLMEVKGLGGPILRDFSKPDFVMVLVMFVLIFRVTLTLVNALMGREFGALWVD